MDCRIQRTVIATAVGLSLLGPSGCSDRHNTMEPQSLGSTWIDVHGDPSASADWLLANQLDEFAARDLASKPAQFHLAMLQHVLQLKGVEKNLAAQTMAEAKALLLERSPVGAQAHQAAEPMAALDACEQPVEWRDSSNGATLSYAVTSFQNGTEFMFHFSPSWTDGPGDLRWAATSGWVANWIIVRTNWPFGNGGVAGHGLCDRPYDLQLGNTTMATIGYGSVSRGLSMTQSSLFIHHI